jgi:hypothetical protein
MASNTNYRQTHTSNLENVVNVFYLLEWYAYQLTIRQFKHHFITDLKCTIETISDDIFFLNFDFGKIIQKFINVTS